MIREIVAPFLLSMLAIVGLLACVSPSKASTQPPSNLVCDRLKLADASATCDPELTTEDMHRARVTLNSQTVACALPANALTVVCGPLFPQEPKAP